MNGIRELNQFSMNSYGTPINSVCLSVGHSLCLPIRPIRPPVHWSACPLGGAVIECLPVDSRWKLNIVAFILVQTWQFTFPQPLMGNALRWRTLARKGVMWVSQWHLTILSRFIPRYFRVGFLLAQIYAHSNGDVTVLFPWGGVTKPYLCDCWFFLFQNITSAQLTNQVHI